MFNFIGKLLDSNEKEISHLTKIVEVINSHEPEMQKLKEAGFVKRPPNLRSVSQKVRHWTKSCPRHLHLCGKRPNGRSVSVISMCR